jgi:hypothetical protein
MLQIQKWVSAAEPAGTEKNYVKCPQSEISRAVPSAGALPLHFLRALVSSGRLPAVTDSDALGGSPMQAE